MNNQQQEITMSELLGMWFAKIELHYRRYQNKREINRTIRDIELTRREIAEKLATTRALMEDLMHLRADGRPYASAR